MLSEKDLIYLGACQIYSNGHYSKESAVHEAKEIFKDIFEDDNVENEKMILD